MQQSRSRRACASRPAVRRRSRSPPSGSGPTASDRRWSARRGRDHPSPGARAARRPARDREQVQHRVGRSADRAVHADRVLERRACQDLRDPHVVLDELARCGGRPGAPARSGGNRPPESRRCPAASGRAPRPSIAIVDAVPMTLHVPVDRDMHDSACMNSFTLIMPAAHFLAEPPDVGARAEIGAAELAVEHRAAGHTRAGRSQLAAPMMSDGVVLSQPHSSTTPSIGLPRIDSSTSMAGEIAEEHRGRAQARLAERHHRELERQPAGFPDAALHVLGQLPEVAVARRQLRPGVADADDRPAVEHVPSGQSPADPAAMNEPVLVGLGRTRRRSDISLLYLPALGLPVFNQHSAIDDQQSYCPPRPRPSPGRRPSAPGRGLGARSSACRPIAAPPTRSRAAASAASAGSRSSCRNAPASRRTRGRADRWAPA